MVLLYNELYHHGIKGQKWYVRRSREELGYKDDKQIERNQIKAIKEAGKVELRKAKKQKKHDDKIEKAKAKVQKRIDEVYSKKKIKDPDVTSKRKSLLKKKQVPAFENEKRLSNDELIRQIERLRLEKTYRELKNPGKKKDDGFFKTVGFGKKVVAPSLTDSGRYLLTNYLKAKGMDVLGVEMRKTGPVLKNEAAKILKDVKEDTQQILEKPNKKKKKK